MACAGSAGGSQPPHRHPFRLPGQCEQGTNAVPPRNGGEWIPPPPPPKKKQGEGGGAKGKQVQAMKQKLGGPIPIIWDPRFPQVRKAVGEYSEKFESELGKIVRNNVPVFTEKWRKVSEQQRELIWKEAQSSFGPLEETHRPAVMSQSSVLLRKWKQRCRKYVDKHVKDKKPGPPPKFHDVDSQEDWDQYLQHIANPKFIEMSERNKKNRSKLSYVGTQRRRSMPGHRFRRLTRVHALRGISRWLSTTTPTSLSFARAVRTRNVGEWIPPPPPPKKKQGERGSAKGKQVQAMKQKLGGPIPIIWDP